MKPIDKSQISSTGIPVERIEVFTKSHLKDIATLGNYIDIFTVSETSDHMKTLYTFTDMGYLICITINLVSKKSSIKIISALADSVVRHTMHSICIKSNKDLLSLCLSHDETQISVVNFLVKPPLLRLASADKMTKSTIKSTAGLRPLAVKFSISKKFVFAFHRNCIDIFKLSYGAEGIVPSLERATTLNIKESVINSCIMPSNTNDEYLYYICFNEKSKESGNLPSLKCQNERNNDIIMYCLKQIQISTKKIEAKSIIKIEMENKIKCLEWSNAMDKLAILTENNKIEVIVMEKIFRACESGTIIKTTSKEYFTYEFDSITQLKSVHWLDNGGFLLVISEDLDVFLFDPCLKMLKFITSSEYKNSIPLSNIKMPKLKNKFAEKTLRKEIETAQKKTVIKRPILIDDSDPLIIGGNFPYNLVIYKLCYAFPWTQYNLSKENLLFKYLDNGKILASLNLLKSINDSNGFIKCFVHISNYLMRRPKILSNCSIINYLIKTYGTISAKSEMSSILNFLKHYYLKLGQRLLTSDYYEEAFQLGLCSESSILMRNIEHY